MIDCGCTRQLESPGPAAIGPGADIRDRLLTLLEHLISAQQCRVRHIDAERFGSFKLYGKFKFEKLRA